MKKTLSISLANLNFVLEEDAYQKLVTYLEQIRIHFSNNPDKDEIVKDIEYSIADKFSKLLSPTKQVISIEDAERVMQEIGSTHDFTKTEMINEEATSYTESEQTEKKRLYRDEEHQVIAGVCAGIANYFDVDVVWIRALFGVLLFTPLFGVVLIVYIILWLSTPPATNVVDKLKMQGEPVTLERIAAQIKDRVQQQDTPEKNIIKKIVSIPVIILTFVFKILKKVIPILFLILASFATILVTGIILLITYVVGVILFFSNSPLVSLPLKDFPSTSLEYLSILLAYLAIILPLVFILSLFISIIKKRFILRTAGTISIVGSWVFIVLFGGILAVGLVPELQPKLRFETEAQEVINLTEQNITNFDKVSILSHGNPRIQAKIIAGSEYKIVVKGKEDALKHLKFYKHTEGTLEGMLDISYHDPALICLRCGYRGVVQMEITMPTVKEVDGGSDSKIEIIGFKNLSELMVRSYDGTQIYLKGTTLNYLQAEARGFNSRIYLEDMQVTGTSTLHLLNNAWVRLTGTGENLYIWAERRASFDARDFKVSDATIEAPTRGTLFVWSTNSLKANVGQNAHLYYKGSPTITSDINVYGKITQLRE